MGKRIKILFLASDPRDVGYRPNLDEEFKQIRKSIGASRLRNSFELACELGVQPAELVEAFSRHKPQIVHYSGHANQKGLVLQNRVGRRTLVSKSTLAELFRVSGGIRVVLLNACYSESQLDAIAKTVDFTIGMKGTIRDNNAITFASAFYRELASGRSINEAFEAAKVELRLQKAPKSKAPELRVREGADASAPFLAKPDTLPQTQKRKRPQGSKKNYNKISARDVTESVLVQGDNANVNYGKLKP
jgi:CHAT domain